MRFLAFSYLPSFYLPSLKAAKQGCMEVFLGGGR